MKSKHLIILGVTISGGLLAEISGEFCLGPNPSNTPEGVVSYRDGVERPTLSRVASIQHHHDKIVNTAHYNEGKTEMWHQGARDALELCQEWTLPTTAQLNREFDRIDAQHNEAIESIRADADAKFDRVLDVVGDLDEQVLGSELIQKLLKKIDALESRLAKLEK